jgi:hypothetical protein
MFLVHEMVAQTGATIGDAAIGEFEVEIAKGGRDGDDEKAVEEANRRVATSVRTYLAV